MGIINHVRRRRRGRKRRDSARVVYTLGISRSHNDNGLSMCVWVRCGSMEFYLPENGSIGLQGLESESVLQLVTSHVTSSTLVLDADGVTNKHDTHTTSSLVDLLFEKIR